MTTNILAVNLRFLLFWYNNTIEGFDGVGRDIEIPLSIDLLCDAIGVDFTPDTRNGYAGLSQDIFNAIETSFHEICEVAEFDPGTSSDPDRVWFIDMNSFEYTLEVGLE